MLTRYIQEIFRQGTLTEEETREAILHIMHGECSAVQIAALLTALHSAGENEEEITGAARAMREAGEHLTTSRQDLLDIVGTGGDGLNTFNISTLAALAAAGAGAAVAKHGNRAMTGKCGAADLLAQLGLNLNASSEKVARSISECGIGFLFAQKMHPAMRYAGPVRRELGFRTIFNLLGPLTNPAAVKYHLIGVYAPQYAPVFAAVLKRLGSRRAMIVCGEDGMDEISVSAGTQVSELTESGQILNYTVTPGQFGLPCYAADELRGSDAVGNAEIARRLLAGEERGAKRSAVLLNAGAALYISGLAADLRDGIQKAAASIDNGDALRKLRDMVEKCQ